MDVTLNIWHTFVLIGALQGFALTAFLAVHSKGNCRANQTLAVLIFSISTDIFISFLYLSNYIHHFPHLISVSEPLYTLYGPLLYLYTKQLAAPQAQLRLYDFLFFLPFALETLFWMPFYLQPASLKLHDYISLNGNHPMISGYWLIWNLELIYNIAFAVLAAKVLKQYEQSIKHSFSDISRINFNWLRLLIRATLIVFLFQLSILYLVTIIDIETLFITFYCLIALLFYGIGYMGLRQPEVFSGVKEKETQTEKSKPIETEMPKKYAKSSLSEEMASTHLEKLLEMMENEKLYLKSDLKLNDVAAQMNISTNHLSQAINTKTGKNFFDFINTYRVREAQRMLISPEYQHLTLLAIGLEAGFSSKSSFNKVFKEHSNLTPSQYRAAKRQADLSKPA